MGNCVFCGEPAGWFRSAHSACTEADYQRKAAEVQAQIQLESRRESARLKLSAEAARAMRSGGNLADLEATFQREVAERNIDNGDQIPMLIDAWRQAALQALDDDILSVEEETSLTAARKHFLLPDTELARDDVLARVTKAAVLRRVMSDELDEINVRLADGYPINIQRNERPVWSFPTVDYYEDRTRRQYVGGSQGVSLRIMKGVYYRVGAFKGESVYSTERTKVDQGLLLLTNRHLYFHGGAKSLRVPYTKIVSFTPFRDGVGIMRDAQTAKAQIFQMGDGWFAYNMVTNLARNAT